MIILALARVLFFVVLVCAVVMAIAIPFYNTIGKKIIKFLRKHQ